MTEPRRFLMDPDASSFERDLLESWSAEQPSSASRARALAIGGLAATGAAFAGAAGAGAAVAPKAAGLVGLGLVKWGVLGMILAGAATATYVSLRAPGDTAPVVVAPPAVPAATTTTTPVATAGAPSTPVVAPADLPAATTKAAPPAVPHVAAVPTPADPPADSLGEEISAFDAVRAAETSGDSARTLALATAYERRYPSGTFLQEAEVLRIDALAKTGDAADAADAKRAGERFLSAHPGSPHAARIRAIVDASPR